MNGLRALSYMLFIFSFSLSMALVVYISFLISSVNRNIVNILSQLVGGVEERDPTIVEINR